jgi:hypothetical protein
MFLVMWELDVARLSMEVVHAVMSSGRGHYLYAR